MYKPFCDEKAFALAVMSYPLNSDSTGEHMPSHEFASAFDKATSRIELSDAPGTWIVCPTVASPSQRSLRDRDYCCRVIGKTICPQ